MKLKKNQLKKGQKKPESTLFNMPNPWLDSWDWDNFIERKSK
jgi:hypothetical protein